MGDTTLSAYELPSLDLKPRVRAGLVIAIVALSVAINPLNRLFRIWLRDEVVKGVPFWLDHIGFMLTLMLVVWGAIGFLLLGARGLSLSLPEERGKAWTAGAVTGVGLTALVIAALAAMNALVFEVHPNYPVMFANFVSNFYEEFIFRGVILGLLLTAMGRARAWTASIISALLFCQGHLQYPPILLSTVFVAGVVWAWLTVKYKSLWPAWMSHTIADILVDSLFKT